MHVESTPASWNPRLSSFSCLFLSLGKESEKIATRTSRASCFREAPLANEKTRLLLIRQVALCKGNRHRACTILIDRHDLARVGGGSEDAIN